MKKHLYLLIVLIITMASNAHASVFSDVMSFFGVDISSEKMDMHIDENIYKDLDENEKEAVKIAEKLYKSIINIDIDEAIKYINIDKEDYSIKYIKEIIDKNPNILKFAKNIGKNLDYKILDVGYKKEDILLDIEYNCKGIIGIFLEDSGRYTFTFVKNAEKGWILDISGDISRFLKDLWSKIR